MEEESLSKVIDILNTTGHQAVIEYAHWYFVSGITWIVIGAISLLYGFKNGVKFSDDEFLNKLIKAGLITIGFLLIGSHIPDVVSSEGIAIHRLISDIRGT